MRHENFTYESQKYQIYLKDILFFQKREMSFKNKMDDDYRGKRYFI